MEDTIINSVVPAAICELESESIVKDEPKLDVEAEIDTAGGCFDVLDMVEEPFDEAPTNFFSSDEEADKMYSNCDSSSESGSPDQSLEVVVADTYEADVVESDDDVDMEEVFETIDGDPNDYEECYVAERPPSPADTPIPRGWKQVYHESGATIFVHLETNVCSLSRPYFLGTNSTKQHKLPTAPVPCLSYRSYLQNRHENVAEYVAFGSTKCKENTASASEVVSNTNVSICPANSSTSTVSVTSVTNAADSHPNSTVSDSKTISDANAVTPAENLTTSIENTTDADMNLFLSSVNLAEDTKNTPNTGNVPTSDADSIQLHANVPISNATTADLASAIISDANLSTCPVQASSYAESAAASGTDASVLSQDLGTSDVIMTDVSVTNAEPDTSNVEATIVDSNRQPCPVHATTDAEQPEKMNEDAGISDTTEITVSSDKHSIISDENVASANTFDATAMICDSNSVTSDIAPPNVPTFADSPAISCTISTAKSATSALNDAITSTSSTLPIAANTIEVTSTMKNVTASNSNVAVPDPAVSCNTISTAQSAVSASNDVVASTSTILPTAASIIEVTSTMKNVTASNSNVAVPDPAISCDTISTAQSDISISTIDAIASTSAILPTTGNTMEATALMKNVTASNSNIAVPDDEGTHVSSMDAETASTRNDTIEADSAVAEEAQLLEYCKRLFKFKKIKYLKFRSWDVRRTYLRALRNERNRRRCPFSNNKVLSFPIETKDSDGNVVATKKWIINPRGRSYVAILHEYLQQSKKTQPEYKFTEVDNARNPYAATVVVNGTEYGTGFGMSKKDAKFEAAKATLEVLLPKMMKYVLSVCCNKTGTKKYEDYSDEDDLQNVASAFDDIEIIDPRVTELSLQTTEPKPYELLLNCLQKKGEQPEVKFEFQAESMESTMAVGENQVTIKCGNKREGKQLAAQAMLQQLHPHIKNWGSLLRLYGNSITNQYRQVTDDKDVEELKCRPANNELLDTLRRRMSSLPDGENEGMQVSERR